MLTTINENHPGLNLNLDTRFVDLGNVIQNEETLRFTYQLFRDLDTNTVNAEDVIGRLRNYLDAQRITQSRERALKSLTRAQQGYGLYFSVLALVIRECCDEPALSEKVVAIASSVGGILFAGASLTLGGIEVVQFAQIVVENFSRLLLSLRANEREGFEIIVKSMLRDLTQRVEYGFVNVDANQRLILQQLGQVIYKTDMLHSELINVNSLLSEKS